MRKRYTVIYMLILIIGIVVISLRGEEGWNFVSGFRFLEAAYNRKFNPGIMEYVATADLKAAHQLRRVDLGFNDKLDENLHGFLPPLEKRVGQILKKDVPAGQPIFPDNFVETPVIKPEPGTCIVVVRLQGAPAIWADLQPGTKVSLALTGPSGSVLYLRSYFWASVSLALIGSSGNFPGEVVADITAPITTGTGAAETPVKNTPGSPAHEITSGSHQN